MEEVIEMPVKCLFPLVKSWGSYWKIKNWTNLILISLQNKLV